MSATPDTETTTPDTETTTLLNDLTLDIESLGDGTVSIKFSGLTEGAFEYILVSCFGEQGADRIALAMMGQIHAQLEDLYAPPTEAARA